MKKKLFFLVLLFSKLFFSQILVNESFEGSSLPSGWSGANIGTSAGQPCSGLKTLVKHLTPYDTGSSVEIKYISSQSNGKDIFYSFKYLNQPISNIIPPIVYLKYSSDNGISWKSLPNFNSPSITANCIPVSGVIPGIDVPVSSNFVFSIQIFGYYNHCIVGIDDVQIIQNTNSFNCFLPVNISTSNINNNSAQINWNTQGANIPDDFEYYISTSNLVPDNNTLPTGSVSGSNNSTILSVLQPSTKYYIWLRSTCGTNQKSFWTNTHTFTTECNPIGPFFENFQSSNTIPNCWTCHDNPYGSCNVATENGNKSIFLNGHSVSPKTIALPRFNNLNSGSNRLKFKLWCYISGPGPDSAVDVGYMTNVLDVATFTSIQTFNATLSKTEYIVVIPSNLPSNARLAFRKNTGNNIYIDDVYWEPVPLCATPTDIAVNSNSLNSITVSWQPSSAGSVNNYELYYSTDSTTPTVLTVPNVTGIMGNTYTITNLDPDEVYYIWVRSSCSLGGGSNWSNYITNQACIPEVLNQTKHAIKDFITSGGIYNINYSVNSYAVYNNQSSKVLTVSKGSTFNYSATSISNFTHYYYIWIDWNKDKQFDNINERIAVYGLSPAFYGSYLVASNRQPGLYKMRVGTSWDDGNLTPCNFTKPDITNFVDFTLEVIEPPTCTQPNNIVMSNISPNSVDLSWQGMTSSGSYDIFYSTNNILPTMNTIPSIQGTVGNTKTINNLVPYTKYYVWIRENCGSGNYSYWSSPVSFETLCQPPIITSTSSGTSCSGGTVNLTAQCTGNCSIRWYNTLIGGSLLHTGTSFLTDNLSSPTPFYAEASYSKEISAIKPIYNGNSYNVNVGSGGLVFNANEFFTLKSVDVFVIDALTNDNNLTVQLLNNNDQIIYTKTFTLVGKPNNTTLPKKNTLNLNWDILPGIDYKIKKSGSIPNLIHDLGVAFPINIGSAGTIKNSLFYPDRYDYFFNWKVLTYCSSQKYEVLANIDNTCLGVNESNNKKDDIQIYPNPFENDLYINSKRKIDYITLNDISGKLIKNINNPDSVLSLSDLLPGIYFLTIKLNNSNVRTFKILKK
ncbi:hypothetical protein ATE47_05065 [Chryseobacterium sp. IHB B 17019]|jgi:hypothetical protein|uniref:fibronectin type III domain-containing protein n=1 Tax=Chryseobacterium sp. IHB B 17019 TaxID=1721091 RepID=UPI000722A7D4|nr:fibronectin type III domain-containing protein [Chryseobacterium sp. IHB B 17019]ALR29930.1 hypothetical protein ATE47_05065 [Chryseobacterium sp. IHB B 17019]